MSTDSRPPRAALPDSATASVPSVERAAGPALPPDSTPRAAPLARRGGAPLAHSIGRAPDVSAIPQSSYLQYLPAPFQADSFLGRYLMIAETIFSSIERTVDNLPFHLDPRVAPADQLPWLASWVDVELDENMPVEKRRAAVARAAGLYRWQGTRRGLRESLQAYAGHPPLIVENFDGLRLGQDAALGVNTRLGEPRPNSVAITVLADDVNEMDAEVVRRIVERAKPAHVTYTAEIRPWRPARAPSAGDRLLPDGDRGPTPAAPWVVRAPEGRDLASAAIAANGRAPATAPPAAEESV